MMEIDDSRQAFQIFKKDIDKFIKEDLSESDTRSKLIDNLLINVMGWREEDIVREKYSEAGFYDYKISIPGLAFIVEAKKQFKELAMPGNHKKTSIKVLFGENQEVITQIRNYCIESGLQYGVITNGCQFIFLKLINTDNKPWKENQCLIFNGLDDIEERFIRFFDNLSKFGVTNNGGFKYDLPVNIYDSKTVISTLLDRDKELVRNSLSGKIAPVINRIFGEIFSEEQEDDLEFIEKCFVKNEEIKKNKDEIEKLFADRAPQLASVIPAINTDNIRDQINEEINIDQVTIKNLNPPNPIIIIGSKGAGKTTFINHLFKYSLSKDDLASHLMLYLDLRSFFHKHSFFEPNKVAKEILELLYEKYSELELHSSKVLKRIYHKQIKRNDEGVWSYDKEHNEQAYNEKLNTYLATSQQETLEHLENLNKYLLRERRTRLIVIIDNADQFDTSIQSEVFIFAHSLARAVLCGTVVSLREGYYYKWRLSPPFDAYESNVYHVTAPKYAEVLQKRIDFTLEKITLERDTIGEAGPGSRMEITNQSVIEFLSGLKNSLFSEHNSSLLDFLSYTTYPNIREGLKIFKQFLTSGHTNVSDYILRERFRMEDRGNPQVIPIHEFVKSIGLQNKHYYNSEISVIHNLFIPPVDSDDHFLKPYLLIDLINIFERNGSVGKFASSKEVIEKFNSFGYRINILQSALVELLKLGILDTDDQLTDIDWQKLPDTINVCITAKGFYYYKELLPRFYYLDLIVQDTPIFDKTYFEAIKLAFPLSNDKGKRLLYDRVETVKKFLKYLKSREQLQPKQLQASYGSVVDHLFQGFDKDMENIGEEMNPTLFGGDA